MTPAEFREGRESLHLSQKQLASLFQVASDRTVRKWEAGERDIPGPARVLMLMLVRSQAVRELLLP